MTTQQVVKSKTDFRNLLDIKDFARERGVTIQTVYTWIKEKRVTTVEIFGKKVIDRSTFKY